MMLVLRSEGIRKPKKLCWIGSSALTLKLARKIVVKNMIGELKS